MLALTMLASAATAQVGDDIVGISDVGPAGAAGATVFRSGAPSSVVIFLHGWKDVTLENYLPWLDYLALNGTAVVFPHYQSPAGGDPAKTLPALRAGVSAAMTQLGNPHVPVIVVGYDYGARLAFYYAANARRWGLPAPYAIDSIFPTEAPAGLPPLPALPASTRVLLQVGADDTVAGAAAAADLKRAIAKRPAARTHYRVVKSTAALRTAHRAPLGTTAAAQLAFWPPVDDLITEAVNAG